MRGHSYQNRINVIELNTYKLLSHTTIQEGVTRARSYHPRLVLRVRALLTPPPRRLDQG